VEEYGRDDFEGDVGDDPFHVSKGVTHYDEDDPGAVEAGDVDVVIERDDHASDDDIAQSHHATPSRVKAVSVAAVIEQQDARQSSPAEDSSDSRGIVADSSSGTDDSDMENPFAD